MSSQLDNATDLVLTDPGGVSRKKRFSFSAYSEYASCGERYRLARVVKVPQKPSMAAVAGSAFHEWTEQWDLESMPIDHVPYPETEDPADILTRLVEAKEAESGIARTDWQISGRKTKDKPNKEDFETWRDLVMPDLCERYIAWHNETDWQIAYDLPADPNGNTTGIEYELVFKVGGTKLRAFVDRVMVDVNGNYGAVDIKTWSQERASVQLPTYIVGLKSKGINATWGAYYNAREGTVSDQKWFMTWTPERLAALYDQAAEMEAAGYYLPHPTGDCRIFCSVASHCEYAV